MVECHPLEQFAIQVKFDKLTKIQDQFSVDCDPIKLLSFMVDVINVSFRLDHDKKFQALIQEHNLFDDKRELIKHFKKSNCTLISKMFRSLVEQQVICPYCKARKKSFKDVSYIKLTSELDG